jgi:hypothetical protein
MKTQQYRNSDLIIKIELNDYILGNEAIYY